MKGNCEYTLVLDLDETLVHYFMVKPTEGTYAVRPGCEKFLTEMGKMYEIVIFTAAMSDYADWVINDLDEEGCIKHRLYRQHLVLFKNKLIKDLSKLGRDLSKVIIVDNLPDNF